MPNSRKPPAGTGGISESDLLAGDQDERTNQETIAAAVEAAVLAGLMAVDDLVAARRLTDRLSPEAFTLADHRAVAHGILLAISAGQPPHPLAVATAMQHADVEAPPTWRGCLLSRLWMLAADPPPACMVAWFLDQVEQQVIRRRIAEAGRVIGSVAHRGELADVAVVVQSEAAAVLELLAGALDANA